MIDKHCDVPCEAVDKKLVLIWEAIGKKVSFLVFSLVLGGILLIAIFFGESVGKRQEKTFDALGAIKTSMSEIKGELKHLNGRGKKW